MGFLYVGGIHVGLSGGRGVFQIPGFGSLDIRDIKGRPDEPKFFVLVGQGAEVHGLAVYVIFFHLLTINYVSSPNYKTQTNLFIFVLIVWIGQVQIRG